MDKKFKVKEFLESIKRLPPVEQKAAIIRQQELVQQDLRRIKEQIEKAKGEAKRSDTYAKPSWWARLNAARRAKGRQAQQLQDACAIANQEIKRHNMLASRHLRKIGEYFMDVAKAELESTEFTRLLKLAKARQEADRDQS